MSDIQAIIQLVANANSEGKAFRREMRKMSETEREKLIEAAQDLRAEVDRLSKTVTSIKQAISPKNPSFIAAGAKAKAAQESAEFAQKIGGYKKIASPASSIGSVKGREFCVTGEVEGKTREELQDLIKSRGGFIRKSVTKGLNVLVIGRDPGLAKIEPALARGIRIVLASDFIKWIEKG